MHWLKLYTEIIDDPKIRLLAFEDRWHYIALLCCKSIGLMDEHDGIWEKLLRVKLGLAEVEFDTLKVRLLEVKLIDDDWNPTGWDKRQAAKDALAAERQKKYRDKQKKRNVTHNVTRDVTHNVTHNVTATSRVERELEEELEKELEKEVKKKTKTARFKKPTIADVTNYILEKDYNFDPEQFVNHYESNGWKVGKNSMKCWKAACANWNKREKENGNTKNNAGQHKDPRRLSAGERVLAKAEQRAAEREREIVSSVESYGGDMG